MIRKLPNLLTAHMDAWGTTFIIGLMCLLLHGASAWGLVITVTVGYWFGFAVNDYFDAPMDRLDPDKAARGYFTTVRVPPLLALAVAALIVALALPVFVSYGTRGIVVFMVALLIVWAYSAPPLRLKSVPGFDVLTHALFVQTFPYVLIMVLLDLPWTPLDIVMIAGFLLASTSAQLEQQVRDYDTDRLSERNFTIWIGRERSAFLMRLLTLVLLVVVSLHVLNGVIPAYLAPFGLVCVPLLLHRFVRRPDQPRSEWLFRATVIVALSYAALLLIFR
jgi:chlorophyll synthase